MNFVDILFASLLANNLLIVHFFGLEEFLSEAGVVTLARRTLFLTFFLLLGSMMFWVADHFVLQAFHLEFFRTPLLLLVLFLASTLYSWVLGLGILPGSWPTSKEILIHSFLVGGIVLVGSSNGDIFEVALAALAVSLGYGAALALLASVFRRLSREAIPAFVQGLPLQLLTLALVWLALHGLGFAFVEKPV